MLNRSWSKGLFSSYLSLIHPQLAAPATDSLLPMPSSMSGLVYVNDFPSHKNLLTMVKVVTAIYQHKTYRSLTMVKGSLVSFIYQQTMNLSSAALSESASLTLMTTDVERVGSGMRLMHETWASMAEVGLALYLLQMQLGVATAAAIGVSLGTFFLFVI
jgi:hypothetical protein